MVFVYFRGISAQKTHIFDITDYICQRILNNGEAISFLPENLRRSALFFKFMSLKKLLLTNVVFFYSAGTRIFSFLI